MAAGILAAFVILFSQSFQRFIDVQQNCDTVEVAHQAEGADDVFIHTGDALPQSGTLQLTVPEIPVQEELLLEKKKEVFPILCKEAGTRFLKVLFRAIIAPNAP